MEGYPILCLHGFGDNCNTFDPIAPLLSERFHYIALDAVGHGKTTHAPAGSSMNYWELVIYIKRAMNHFKLEKYSILGHSMGGGTAILVASLYPDAVDRVLTLDIVKPITVPLAWQTQSITEAIDLHLDLERKSGNPKYQKSNTLEELVDRYVQALGETISPEAVRILLKRGSRVCGNGFAYSHDPRMVILSANPSLKITNNSNPKICPQQMLPSIMRFGVEEQRQVVKGLRCHLKIVKAKQGPLYEAAELLEEFKAIYKRQCASYEYDDSVDGTHHFHMHHPERVAPIINDYFARL